MRAKANSITRKAKNGKVCYLQHIRTALDVFPKQCPLRGIVGALFREPVHIHMGEHLEEGAFQREHAQFRMYFRSTLVEGHSSRRKDGRHS